MSTRGVQVGVCWFLRAKSSAVQALRRSAIREKWMQDQLGWLDLSFIHGLDDVTVTCIGYCVIGFGIESKKILRLLIRKYLLQHGGEGGGAK